MLSRTLPRALRPSIAAPRAAGAVRALSASAPRWTPPPPEATGSAQAAAAGDRPNLIDPTRLGSMHALTPEHGHVRRMQAVWGEFRVLFIGAGNINFGSVEGPWNHSFRLEHKLQTRMRTVGIIDPDTKRAEHVKEAKCHSFVERAYKDAAICKTLDDFVAQMKPEDKPHGVIIGSPAKFHGSDVPGADLELQILKHFGPMTALFIEKPISAAAVPSTYALATELEKRGTVASVGYMLRYLQVIQRMQRIIHDTGKPVVSVVARYFASYAHIQSKLWWDKTLSLGPIVEQGTHMVDLMRYFGGEVVPSTVQATCVEHDETPGKLEAMPIDESGIPPENRVPRTTCATWKYESGAVGSFVHGLTLQGTAYATELDVNLDGWQLRVTDLYNEPTLFIRSPEADAEQRVTFREDDPYFGEISAWIDMAEHAWHGDKDGPKESHILSSFRDACNTYNLTFLIKEASERAFKVRN